jgi:hypothetical protein
VSGQIPRLIGSIALVAPLLVSGMGVAALANIARADDCRSAPNFSAPQGRHWYYRLDWATQRKCWYLRAFGQPVQQAAASAALARVTPMHSMPAPSEQIPAADGAPMSVSTGNITSLAPRVKMLAVKPKSAQAITATADKLDQRSAQEGITEPSTIEAAAPQASTSSQTTVQAAASASAASMAWPDAPPAVAVKTPEPIAISTNAPAASASDDAKRTARGAEPTNNAGMPIIIFPILALGLAAIGILSRVFIKIAAAHRARTMINHPESERVDDQRQHEWRDDQEQHVSVGEPREYHSLITAISDYSPFQAEDGSYQITHEINKRRNKLAQLHQDLDRLLQQRDMAMGSAG